MDVRALIEQARDAGLKLSVAQGKLIVKGPRRLSPLVKMISECKDAVIAAISLPDFKPAVVACQNTYTVGVTETPITTEKQIGFADKDGTADGRGDQSATIGSRIHRSLIGCGFTHCPTTIPPDSIRAAPVVLCPRCTNRPVLRELRHMTGGLCWACWEAGQRPPPA
jgi:hypothetical protein